MAINFNVGDLVMQNGIGTICMRITMIGYDFDEEAKDHFVNTTLNVLVNKHDNSNVSFNEDAHKIYFTICEWRDERNELHKEKFKIEELTFCPEPFRYKTIEGFRRLN